MYVELIPDRKGSHYLLCHAIPSDTLYLSAACIVEKLHNFEKGDV